MTTRRREPWPFALALALAAMIAVCVGFYAIAASHPDPPLDLERTGLRPSEGYVATPAGPPAAREAGR
jgi:hypothetical protein